MSDNAKFTSETITWLHTWTPTLFSFRITRPDGYRFVPGQFARLGVRKADPAARDGSGFRLVWRAYSMVSTPDETELEFFSIVVPGGEFTTELTRLRIGDTIELDKASFGFLTTERFTPARDLWLLATGTGLAPFLSILRDPQVWRDYENLILVYSVRQAAELAYPELIRSLQTMPSASAGRRARLIYIPTVTREHVNAIAGTSAALGTRVTSLLSSGQLEQAAGLQLDPQHSRVMLCGNPAMVKDTRKLLAERGIHASRRGQPGQLAIENYW